MVIQNYACAICLENLQIPDSTTIPHPGANGIGHRVHSACLGIWRDYCTQASASFTCPVCRITLDQPIQGIARRIFVPRNPQLELIIAAQNNQSRRIISLLERDAPFSMNAIEWALRAACEKGHLESANVLLANATISQETRGSCLQIAAELGDPRIVSSLLHLGVPILESYRGIALITAAEKGFLPIVQQLVENRDVPLSFESQGVAMIAAAFKRHLNVVLYLNQKIGNLAELDPR